MAHLTQKAILRTFGEMLEEMPFDKITVSAIVARCEISSNTFYYHYRDIYDLLEVWLQTKRDAILRRGKPGDTWADVLKNAMHEMQDHSGCVYHTVNSVSRERLEQYVFSSVEVSFFDLVKKQAAGKDIADDMLQTISNFYCYSLLGFLMKFIWNHMEGNVEEMVDRLQVVIGAMNTQLEKGMLSDTK